VKIDDSGANRRDAPATHNTVYPNNDALSTKPQLKDFPLFLCIPFFNSLRMKCIAERTKDLYGFRTPAAEAAQ
jgi:hypothetical protein